MFRRLSITWLIALIAMFCMTNASAFMAPSLADIEAPNMDNNADYSSSIFADMRSNFQLQDDTYMPAVEQQIQWWQEHSGYLDQLLVQARPYIYYVYQQTQERNLPAELALIPFIESQYNPFAVSRVGALGLWQMMPGTASGFGLKINWWYDGRRDVVASTSAALDYFTYLYNFFDQNWYLAIAAYDSGEGTVLDAVRYNERKQRKTDFWNLPLPSETKDYLPKILALAAIIKNPNQYGIELPYIPDRPYFASVDVQSQIDINEVAKLAGVSDAMIRQLNSGFRRWATDPDGPYTILIPVAHAQEFANKLDHLPKEARVTWHHYYVSQGDTLSKIAQKYKTTVSIIKEVNNLKDNTIQIKQSLLIPESDHYSITSKFLRSRATIAEINLPGPQRMVYVVQSGNSLWSIAKQFDITVRDIRFWNNLSAKHVASPGEKLTLWLKKRHWSHPSTVNYQVRQGDSLGKIANEFNTSIDKIKSLNQLHNNIIHVNQTLKIPSTITTLSGHHAQHSTRHQLKREIYHVRPGDNLATIAKRFGVKEQSIISWNHLTEPNQLQPKQELVIYKLG